MQPPNTHYLQAAVGWIELGNYLEANEELERITPQVRAHPDVLTARWQIYAHAKKLTWCEFCASDDSVTEAIRLRRNPSGPFSVNRCWDSTTRSGFDPAPNPNFECAKTRHRSMLEP